jgi:dTDP-glucose pyrophosphorylase
MKNISDLYLLPTDILSKAIEVLHKAGKRIALVVDDKSRLLGTITDGDIRRALLDRKEMDTNVQEIMSKKPLTASENDSKGAILKLMKDHDILHIPILNSQGILVDLEIIAEVIEKPSFQNPVMIMAGGFGKRLLPLTKQTPKPLLKVGSKPILETILERFIDFGFSNFYISTFYKSDMIRDYFSNGSKWGVSIQYIVEDRPLGTAGALSLLPGDLPELPLILMNGDLVTDLDFHSLLENHIKSKAEISVCVVEYDFQVPYGVIEAKDHKVQKIVEKPKHKFFVNAGIYIINSGVIKSLNKTEYLDMPDLLRKRIKNSNGVNMFPLYEEWLDIGRMSELERANKNSNE